jgi:hypothetical protein
MLNYFLNIAAAFIALLYLAKDWPAHKKSWRRLSVLGLIVLTGIGGLFNTYYVKKHSDDQHQADQGSIDRLKIAVETANKSQEDNTRHFVEAFGNLSQKVSNLEGC